MEPGTVGFDTARLQLADGSLKTLTRAEYEALPLSERISMVLRRQVEFFREGERITTQEALRI